MDYRELLNKVLYKRAKGYTVKEKVEEYSFADGEPTLTKRKVTTKHVQSDINAVKALLEMDKNNDDVCTMTDEQLETEKQRLLNLLSLCDESSTQTKEIKQDDN
ncbi:MAG TPA: hypothetical protein IAD47_00370 [Candidatus Limihabitans stercoravium]|nr:hypothetical protein [Candidatus Limihabitans stercoravium]